MAIKVREDKNIEAYDFEGIFDQQSNYLKKLSYIKLQTDIVWCCSHTIGWDNSKIITTNRCYHQRLCLEAWHINSAHVPLNRDDGGLLPDAYLHLVRKRPLISDHIKGPLVAASRSPLMKAIDRSIEALGLLTGIKELLKTRIQLVTRQIYCTQDVWLFLRLLPLRNEVVRI